MLLMVNYSSITGKLTASSYSIIISYAINFMLRAQAKNLRLGTQRKTEQINQIRYT